MPVPRHGDRGNQHDHERAFYDQLQIVFQPTYPDTGDPLHDESVIAVREEPNVHLILPRDVTDDSRHMTLHVPLTAETKDPHQRESAHEVAERRDAESTWRAQKRCTRERELLEDLSLQNRLLLPWGPKCLPK